MLPFTLVGRLRYILERQLVKGAHYQLMVVAVFIGLISLIGGWLAWPSAAADMPLADSVWWAFLRLTDPGYLGDDEGTWRRIVSTALTIMGYVVFMGTLVAIMTRWLISSMATLEQGLTPVTMRNHVVILGWTNRTIPLIREILDTSGGIQRLLLARETKRVRLVILANEVNAARMQELRDEPGIGRHGKHIILRSGTALQPEALHRVACMQAAVVMIPGRSQGGNDLVTGDMETIKALLTLQAHAHLTKQPPPYVVAEIEDVRKVSIMRRAYKGPMEILASDAIVSRVMAQSIIHPGLPEFFGEVMSVHEGNEFYVRSSDGCLGMSLAELAATCPAAILCGILRPEGDQWISMLNAASSTLVGPGDKLVMLARSYADADPVQKTTERLRLLERPAVSYPPAISTANPQLKVLILGWNNRLPALIDELASYSPQRFQVQLLSTLDEAKQREALSRYSVRTASIGCEHMQGDFMLESLLKPVLARDWDSVLLISSDQLGSGEEADARAMVGYMLVDELIKGQSKKPQLLLELSDPSNEALVARNRGECIISPMILSHLMAQIAQRRELSLVIEDLFTAGGPEILYRSQADYPMHSVNNFADLEAVAALKGETAMGVNRHAPDEAGRRLELNPARDIPLKLKPGDQLVILSSIASAQG